jgi:hypothetical protein
VAADAGGCPSGLRLAKTVNDLSYVTASRMPRRYRFTMSCGGRNPDAGSDRIPYCTSRLPSLKMTMLSSTRMQPPHYLTFVSHTILRTHLPISARTFCCFISHPPALIWCSQDFVTYVMHSSRRLATHRRSGSRRTVAWLHYRIMRDRRTIRPYLARLPLCAQRLWLHDLVLQQQFSLLWGWWTAPLCGMCVCVLTLYNPYNTLASLESEL